jgi:hypothetical protein
VLLTDNIQLMLGGARCWQNLKNDLQRWWVSSSVRAIDSAGSYPGYLLGRGTFVPKQLGIKHGGVQGLRSLPIANAHTVSSLKAETVSIASNFQARLRFLRFVIYWKTCQLFQSICLISRYLPVGFSQNARIKKCRLT